MACVEHECSECGYMWFDNQWVGKCPKCGSLEVSNDYDEEI